MPPSIGMQDGKLKPNSNDLIPDRPFACARRPSGNTTISTASDQVFLEDVGNNAIDDYRQLEHHVLRLDRTWPRYPLGSSHITAQQARGRGISEFRILFLASALTSYARNWIYRSDDSLYAERWQQVLDPKFDPEFVQILSWNDYGESHYIGPILGAQPGSEAWTHNRDHAAWREMTRYFVQRYKGLPRSNPRVSIRVKRVVPCLMVSMSLK
jgi:hypothetical protein